GNGTRAGRRRSCGVHRAEDRNYQVVTAAVMFETSHEQRNPQAQSPTVRLLAGLVITLSSVVLYSGYTIVQLRGLEHLQGGIIDRNRADSLLLLRIQNNLNSLGTAMRDMLDGSEPYPLTAWQGQFRRIRTDLEDAMAREARFSPLDRDA